MTSVLTDLTISSKSLQYVKVQVSTDAGSDPTGDVVTLAFPAVASEPVTFYTASWETLSGNYYARCLVGTGGAVTLAVGFYDVYVKISASPETPVFFAGRLEVT